MRINEVLGAAVGVMLAPWAAAGSFLRGARLFHPDGVIYSADVIPLAGTGPLGDIAHRLAGPALVRLSSALRRDGRPKHDVLGCAVRFRSDPEAEAAPECSDQDMLFATFRNIPAMAVAMLTTHRFNFLRNDYYAVLPFDTPGLGRTKWRLVGSHVKVAGGDRYEKLARAASEGVATFRLEVRKATFGATFEQVAEIRLRENVAVDQNALLFHPYRTGRGIVPRGFFQAMRLAVYPASYIGRSLRGRVSRSRAAGSGER